MRALAHAASCAISATEVPELSIWRRGYGGVTDFCLDFQQEGVSVIARIPPVLSDGRRYKHTVAAMTYARYVLDVPFPKVLAWNSTYENPVGIPYILMEKPSGLLLRESEVRHGTGPFMDSLSEIQAKMS